MQQHPKDGNKPALADGTAAESRNAWVGRDLKDNLVKQNRVKGLAGASQPVYVGGNEGYLLQLQLVWKLETTLEMI